MQTHKLLKVFITHQAKLQQIIDKFTKLFNEDFVIIVGGYKENQLEGNIIKLKCDDSYCGLSDKVTSMFKFINENSVFDSYTHFHKIDDDVEFIKDVDFPLTDYMGVIAGKHKINYNHHIGRCEGHYWNDKPYEGEISDWCEGGLSYIVSRKAIKCIAKVDGKQYPLEDVMVANILENNGIYPTFINMTQYYKPDQVYDPIKTYKDLKGRTWNQPGIPKWIFRFGNESVENLHPKVIEIYNKQLKDNPDYELFYFDTKDKLQFAQHFGDPRVEATYNKLIPPAFKSDFLKFVLLYTYGGVYMDFSMEPLLPLKDIFKGYKRVLARDTPAPDGMCIGFITSEKGDELMREAMEKCIYNTTYNLYGTHILDITGPIAFSRVYKKLNHVDQIPIGKVSDDLYFYDMADALNIYDNGVPVIRLRMENHHKLLYNHEYDEDSPSNLHYHILYPKGKVFSRKINTYKDLKGKVWPEGGIPKWIFKTGPFEVDELPEIYKHIFLDMLDKNPNYELFYFSDADCEEFIKDNYDEEYFKDYDILIPTAYKADFFRTLLLYTYGGCYGDFSQSMLVSFDTLTEGMDRVLVVDTPASTNSLYNAFMCNKAGDDVLRRTIDFIRNNIDKRYYGIDTLDVTGPRVLGRAYCEVIYRNAKSFIHVGKYDKTNMLNNPHETNMFITDFNGTPMILKKLANHWDIVYNNRGVKHYGELWHAGKVFKY